MTGKPTPLTQSEDRLALCYRCKRHLGTVRDWIREHGEQYGAGVALMACYSALDAVAELRRLEDTWYSEVLQTRGGADGD